MTTKTDLEKRIRGWLPKEPTLPRRANPSNLQEEKAKMLPTHTPLGLKLVVALFWISGVGTILALVEQAIQMAYLPLDARLLMTAVTVADGAALFVLGAGLLTVKKRWVDAAIVFSVASLVAFYLVPMRFALPLEAVALAYLVALRWGKGAPAKSAKMVPVALLVLLCVASFAPVMSANASIIEPSRTLIQSSTQTSPKGSFNVTVNLYQYVDLDDEKDYYFLEIELQCVTGNFNYAAVNASLENVTTIIGHIPQSSPSYPVALAFGIPTLYIGNSETVFVYSDYATYLNWKESTLNPQSSGTFSTDLWVPQNAHISASVNVAAGFRDEVFGGLWSDQLNSGAIQV